MSVDDEKIYFYDTKPLSDEEAKVAQDLADQMKRHYTYDDMPFAAIDRASRAAGDKMGMGALHVGSHVLIELLNYGIVVLNPANDNTPWTKKTSTL